MTCAHREELFCECRADWDGSRDFTPGREIRQTYIEELANEATRDVPAFDSGEPGSPSSAPVCTALRIAGMLQWDSTRCPWLPVVYQWLARGGLVCSAASFFVLATRGANSSGVDLLSACHVDECWRQTGVLSQLPLPIGALIAVLPLGLRRYQLRLEQTLHLVRSVSVERGYQEREAYHHRWDIVAFTIMWLSSVVAAWVRKRGACCWESTWGTLESGQKSGARALRNLFVVILSRLRPGFGRESAPVETQFAGKLVSRFSERDPQHRLPHRPARVKCEMRLIRRACRTILAVDPLCGVPARGPNSPGIFPKPTARIVHSDMRVQGWGAREHHCHQRRSSQS